MAPITEGFDEWMLIVVEVRVSWTEIKQGMQENLSVFLLQDIQEGRS